MHHTYNFFKAGEILFQCVVYLVKQDKIRHSLCLGRKLKTKVTSFYKTVKGDGADAAFWGCVTVGGESGTRNMAGNVWSTENK